MFRASREHLGNMLKERFFQNIIDEKVVFMLQVYDLTITNVVTKQCFQNIRNVFTNFCFKNILRISPEECKVMKMLLWNQKVQRTVLWVIL